ncbi:aminoglycoside phosphotransferase family protein [Xylanimonas protaetiae]|uniref:Aminoglycoside phosphotransferase family protein n=1 Tax=Xylanimonas protaetiae TaxID=2509457 RepID=A0A4P6F509_9MICO|nr:aminoglycoside phosphotransferase family protein [Xylanimonas protaetiae]QAY70436.1 aminoglycoside phosphotransferase family protein [Xylanimonas protaetiae]
MTPDAEKPLAGGEVPLAGGTMNAVVRVGETVRRPAGAWTPTVHALLAWVRAHGVDGVPAPLGLDGQGREVLTYVPGVVGGWSDADWTWAPAVLADAARLLRAWHDASVGFPRDGAVWRAAAHEPAEVVCLNDGAPYNMVGGPDGLAGFIDVDMASPGPRVRDLAYLAYRLCPFAEDAAPPAGTDPHARLAALVAAYSALPGATVHAADVLAAIPPRLLDLADFSEARAASAGRADLRDHAAMYRRDAARLARA